MKPWVRVASGNPVDQYSVIDEMNCWVLEWDYTCLTDTVCG